MAGVFNPTPWFPFHDANGRQGWFNPATGQTTYQMYGYNGMPMMPQPAQVPMQPQMYQAPQMQVPMGYPSPVQQQMPQMPVQQQMPQMPVQQQMPQMPVGAAGWQTLVDRNGRRYYYNQSTGQTMYY